MVIHMKKLMGCTKTNHIVCVNTNTRVKGNTMYILQYSNGYRVDDVGLAMVVLLPPGSLCNQ